MIANTVQPLSTHASEAGYKYKQQSSREVTWRGTGRGGTHTELLVINRKQCITLAT